MTNESLPSGWSNCKLVDIVAVNPKKIDAEPSLKSGFIPMANAPVDFQGELKVDEKLWGEIKKSYTNFQDNDVIFAKVTPCFENGKAAIVSGLPNGIGAGSSEFYVLRRHAPYISEKYVFGLIKSQGFMQEGAANMTGAVGLRRVPRAFVENYPVQLPPIAEQKVIADKLDSLLAQVETTKARLDRIPEILKRFRQSVLAAAVSGRLSEEWRGKNEVPFKWESKPFLELISILRSGSGDKPSDDSRGVAILRSSAVRPRVIDYSDVKYLQNEDLLKDNNYLKNGDLLFTRLSGSVEYVGNCALVKGITKKYQYPDRLFCARLKDQGHAAYLEYFFSSNDFRKHIFMSIKSSAGHQRITLDAIRTAVVSLPSSMEQTEIVRRVEELFAYADAVEQKAQAASERVNNLTQSILAKAFRGDLTKDWRATNPDLISGENSAEALLEKIKLEREALKPKKKVRAKKVKK